MLLEINKKYTNKDIIDKFGGNHQKGIRISSDKKNIILITKNTIDNLYNDQWEGEILYYTGMGRKGDQVLNRENKELKDSKFNPDITIHLFEVFKDSEYTYAGTVKLCDEVIIVDEEDVEGKMRKVFKFPLKLQDHSYNPVQDLEKLTKDKRKSIFKKDNNTIIKRAIKKSERNDNRKVPSYRLTETKSYDRDLDIREAALRLANGICQLCDKNGPFLLDGRPYLHAHHIEYLANGGKDILENVIAVCPNCHEKIHKLELPEDKKKLLEKVKLRNNKIKENNIV